VKEGTASHTARSVAARRLAYDRVAAPYGDPAADEALTGDVADGLVAPRGLEPYPRGWRAGVPAPAALQHSPVPLPRGGYPDGR